MATETELERIAREIAEQALSRVSQLKHEIFEMEMRIAGKRAEQDAASGAPQRLANFAVKIGADYQCPRCWIENETRSPLIPIGGGTRDSDFFRCRKCGSEFVIPV